MGLAVSEITGGDAVDAGHRGQVTYAAAAIVEIKAVAIAIVWNARIRALQGVGIAHPIAATAPIWVAVAAIGDAGSAIVRDTVAYPTAALHVLRAGTVVVRNAASPIGDFFWVSARPASQRAAPG